jgi:hypothetical protein
MLSRVAVAGAKVGHRQGAMRLQVEKRGRLAGIEGFPK